MESLELVVTRTIAAPPEAIFDAWLDSTRPGGPWYGVAELRLDAVVGGLFFHSVRHEGRAWAHYGRFLRLERPRLIEHTWMSEATRGFDSIVALTLEAVAGGSRVTLRHSGLPDDAMGRRHADGWTYVLGAIEARLAAASAGARDT